MMLFIYYSKQICFSGFKYYHNPKIQEHAYRNFSVNFFRGGSVILMYTKSLFARLIFFKESQSTKMHCALCECLQIGGAKVVLSSKIVIH